MAVLMVYLLDHHLAAALGQHSVPLTVVTTADQKESWMAHWTAQQRAHLMDDKTAGSMAEHLAD